MSVALATQLREGTKKSHTMAENTGFVSCFLKGVVDKASYRKLVADLYFVYTAMEEEIAKLGDHPVVGPVGMQSSTVVKLWNRISPTTSVPAGKNKSSRLPQLRPMWSGFMPLHRSRPNCWWGITTPATSAISPADRS